MGKTHHKNKLSQTPDSVKLPLPHSSGGLQCSSDQSVVRTVGVTDQSLVRTIGVTH